MPPHFIAVRAIVTAAPNLTNGAHLAAVPQMLRSTARTVTDPNPPRPPPRLAAVPRVRAAWLVRSRV